MANAGELAELVNAEQVTLSRASNDFGQLFNIRWNSKTPTHKRTTLDKKMRRYAGQPDISISGEILITQPEITTFVGLHTISGGKLTASNWDLKVTAKDTSVDTVRISGIMTGLGFIAPEKGGSWFTTTIENQTEAITEP
jgi:hypothetical protein